MNMQTFLHQISDDQGPMQMIAAETIERMSEEDFYELIRDMNAKDRHPVTLELLDKE